MLVETDIPARLDRLPWTRFHALLIIALGITWLLDGLEVTIIGAMGGILQDSRTLHLTTAQIGEIGSFYLIGAVGGAIMFGWAADRFGRRRIFYVTLGFYVAGAGLTAMSWNFVSFALFRLITGIGIGGEYAAINSAIDELIPARLRGRLDLAINGTYWLGAVLGAMATLVLLNPTWFLINIGWRLGFGLGALLAIIILLLRRLVPESPRWLIAHGHKREAEAAMEDIERRVSASSGASLSPATGTIQIYPRKTYGFGLIARTMLGTYRARSGLVIILMAAQAFLYNALFFTYALILIRFYGVDPDRTGLYLIPLAIGNFLGPLLLGKFFDTIGRRKMIAGTYLVSGLLLAGTGYLFATGALSAATQTLGWTMIFFFASAAASAAYLTASEIFPLEMRAIAIACFYAIGTAVGGVVAPWIFGSLIGTGSRWYIFDGYLAAVCLMLVAAGAAALFGIDAENRSLESIAPPLSSKEY